MIPHKLHHFSNDLGSIHKSQFQGFFINNIEIIKEQDIESTGIFCKI